MTLRHLLSAGWRAVLAGLLLMPVTPGAVAAAEPAADEARPHHLSVVLAGTRVPEAEETGFTLGLDYEYRLTERIGLGFVVERAFGDEQHRGLAPNFLATPGDGWSILLRAYKPDVAAFKAYKVPEFRKVD